MGFFPCPYILHLLLNFILDLQVVSSVTTRCNIVIRMIVPNVMDERGLCVIFEDTRSTWGPVARAILLRLRRRRSCKLGIERCRWVPVQNLLRKTTAQLQSSRKCMEKDRQGASLSLGPCSSISHASHKYIGQSTGQVSIFDWEFGNLGFL